LLFDLKAGPLNHRSLDTRPIKLFFRVDLAREAYAEQEERLLAQKVSGDSARILTSFCSHVGAEQKGCAILNF
jgi:hypothetical protein